MQGLCRSTLVMSTGITCNLLYRCPSIKSVCQPSHHHNRTIAVVCRQENRLHNDPSFVPIHSVLSQPSICSIHHLSSLGMLSVIRRNKMHNLVCVNILPEFQCVVVALCKNWCVQNIKMVLKRCCL